MKSRIGGMNIIIVAGLASLAVAVCTFLVGMMHEVQDERIEKVNDKVKEIEMKIADEDPKKFKPRGTLVKNPPSSYQKK